MGDLTGGEGRVADVAVRGRRLAGMGAMFLMIWNVAGWLVREWSGGCGEGE